MRATGAGRRRPVGGMQRARERVHPATGLKMVACVRYVISTVTCCSSLAMVTTAAGNTTNRQERAVSETRGRPLPRPTATIDPSRMRVPGGVSHRTPPSRGSDPVVRTRVTPRDSTSSLEVR